MKRHITLLPFLAALLLSSCSLGIIQDIVDDDLEDAGNFSAVTVTGDTSWQVCVVTDSHIGRKNNEYPDNLKVFSAWWQTHGSSFKALIHLGDMTDDSAKSQYLTARDYFLTSENLGSLYGQGLGLTAGSTFFATPGNHDIRHGDGRSHFKDYFGQGEWKLVLGDVSIYILDSSNRYFGKTQLDKLDDGLSGDGNGKIFMTHMPLGSQNIKYWYLTLADGDERDYLIDLMDDENVRLFADGHRHIPIDPYSYNDHVEEVSLAALSGPETMKMQKPYWYVFSYDGSAKELEVTRYAQDTGESAPSASHVLSVSFD